MEFSGRTTAAAQARQIGRENSAYGRSQQPLVENGRRVRCGKRGDESGRGRADLRHGNRQPHDMGAAGMQVQLVLAAVLALMRRIRHDQHVLTRLGMRYPRTRVDVVMDLRHRAGNLRPQQQRQDQPAQQLRARLLAGLTQCKGALHARIAPAVKPGRSDIVKFRRSPQRPHVNPTTHA
jgi:hypothetical protein